MGAYAIRRKFVLRSSTRPHMADKSCTGGYHKRLREQGPFGASPDFMDAYMPPLTKGMELFLWIAYAPIPKQFNKLQLERYFENHYK